MHPLAFGRHLDGGHLLEHLHPALDLRGLGRLVPELVDEVPDAGDLLVLPLLLLAQHRDPRIPFHEVFRVGPDVRRQGAPVDLDDPGHHPVEEVAVVGHEHEGVRIVGEIVLEPVAGLEVEMVRGLVEQQNVRPLEDQLGEGDAHLPAAGERVGGLLEVGRGETEPVQHPGDLQVDGVAVLVAEPMLQLAVPFQDRVVVLAGVPGVGEAMLEVLHGALDVEQRLERGADLGDQGASRVAEAVLRKIADGQPGALRHRSAVGLVETGQHP